MRSYALILVLLAFASVKAHAQFQGQVFQQNSSVKVFYNGNEKTLAWCGGANSPQLSLADINNDGKKDLAIYEQYLGVKTFLNYGSAGSPQYRYAPQYEHNFPYVFGYMKLVDYNGDNISDLVQRGGAGFAVYRGYYNSKNELCFNFYKELWYHSAGIGWQPAYVDPGDIPGLDDVDNDGDLDFFAYNIWGNFIGFYRNCRVEEGLPADSIKICLKDNCWGKAYQGVNKAHYLGVMTDDPNSGCSSWGVSCKGCSDSETGNKVTHQGNALLVLDYDGDGDYDYMDGNASYSDVQFVKNGKADYSYPIDSMVSQDSTWNSNGHMLHMPNWAAPFWLDIDQDNDRDLLFTPHELGSENYKSIAYYKNTGTDNNPVFAYQSDTFLMEDMIDLGTHSYPLFYDYNKDGKTDLFIGSDGYYQSDGTLKSMVSYYENTSSGSNYSLTLQTKDFLQLSTHNFKGAALAIGDIDNDGKDDLIIGHTDGTLTYFKNTAPTGTMQPSWNLAQLMLKNNQGDTIEASSNAVPCIYDIDKDGKKDLIIGNNTGYLYYYQGKSAGGTINLQYVTNKLGNVKVDADVVYGYSAPYIGKMDNTEVDYLVVGSQSGRLYRYDGFQNGNTTTPYAVIDSIYAGINSGLRSAPAFTDLDGDKKYDLVVGNYLGGVGFYKQLFNVNINPIVRGSMDVRVYPNPSKDMVYISWQPNAVNSEVTITLTSVTGQKLSEVTTAGANSMAQLPVQHIPSGTYYCVVQSGFMRSVHTVSVIK